MNGHPIGTGGGGTEGGAIPYVDLPAEILGGGRVQLARDVTRIGRSDHSEIAINSSHVSRHHAEIVRTSEGCRVVNRSRKNPVQVDGVVVTEAQGVLVRDGARLRFPGGLELVFRDGRNPGIDPPTGEFPAVVATGMTDAVAAPAPQVAELAPPPPAMPAPAVPIPSAPRVPSRKPASTRTRQALFAMGVQVALMLAMGAYLRWGLDDPAALVPDVPAASPIARGAPIAMPFDHDDPATPVLPDPTSDPVADQLAQRLAILEAESDFARELARLGQMPARETPPPDATPPDDPTSQPPAPPPAPPTDPSAPPTKTPPVSPPPDQDPPAPRPDPPLPPRRDPLVAKAPVLRGASGELDRATVRLYDLAAIIPAFADHACPRIAPPKDDGSRDPDRLVIWVCDTGPKTTAELDVLARLVGKHFTGRARVSHTLVPVAAEPRFGAPGNVDALVASFGAAKGQADRSIHDLVRAAGKAAAHYRDWPDRLVVLFSADNGDVEAAVETVGTYLRKAHVPLFPIVPGAALSCAFWWRHPGDPSIALAHRLELIPASAESAVVELPWGLVTMPVDPQATVSAGFAPHAWGRLAASTGGAAYLYAKDAQAQSYCALVGCGLCAAKGMDHECDACYAEERLAGLEPTAMSRGWYAGRLDECRAAQVLRQVWEGGARARVFGARPPDGPGPTPAYAAEVAKEREADAKLDPGVRALIEAFNQAPSRPRGNPGRVAIKARQLADFRERVEAQREALRVLGSRLASFAPSADVPPFQQRALAHANAAWVSVVASEFTLVQQLIALDGVAKAWTADVRVMGLEVCYDNFPLCHGARALLEVEWPGGPAYAEALGRYAKKVDPRQRALGATPWELAIRRAVIRRYDVVARPIELRDAEDAGDKGDKGDKDDKDDKGDKPDTNRPRTPPKTTMPKDPPETEAPPPTRPDGNTPTPGPTPTPTPRTGG